MKKDVFTWTYIVLLVVCGLFTLISIAGVALQIPSISGVNFLFFSLYLLVFLAIIRLLPLWRTGSAVWVALSLLWGGGVCVSLVMVTEFAIGDLMEGAGLSKLDASISGGFTEEFVKGCGVFIILMMARRVWDRPWHGMMAGLCVGMGFEVVENVLYSSMGALFDPHSDVAGAISMWGLRSLFGIGLHPMCTALAGWGIANALLIKDKKISWRVGVALAWWLAAFFFHGLWNYSWPESMQVFVLGAAWIALLVITIINMKKCWYDAKIDQYRPVPTHWFIWGKNPPMKWQQQYMQWQYAEQSKAQQQG